jgi:thioredoxin 1
MQKLTDQNFEKEIQEAKVPVLVDFFATWCEPCKMLGPVLEKVAEDLKDKIILEKVNVDEFPITSQRFQIDRIPAVILFKDGKPASGFVGFRSESEIKNWIGEFLK